MTVDEAYAKYPETDKLGPTGIHCYGPVYDELFGPIRESVKSVLEIGVRFGGSLRAWRDYFPNAQIFGIDNGTEGGKIEWEEDRIKTFYGDECKPDTMVAALDRIDTSLSVRSDHPHDGLGIIVDDGHHHPYVQAAMFAMGWPYLAKGGWYIIEDVEDWTFAKRLAELFGGEYRDLRHVRGRHDSIMCIFRK